MTDETTNALDDANAARSARRVRQLRLLGLVVAALGLVWLLWYLIVGVNHVTTDNAYVGGDVAQVTPLVTSSVGSVEVQETQQVKRGDVLVRLTHDDISLALASAQANYDRVVRSYRGMVASTEASRAAVSARDADIASAEADLESAVAAQAKAAVDFKRRNALAKSGAVSGDELTSATNALAAADAGLAQAQARVTQARAARETASEELKAAAAVTGDSTVMNHPDVVAARNKLESARLDLQRTVIRAKIDGVITRRQVQVGQRVAAGTVLMTIVPIDKLFVDANFKENQLEKVRIGQPVKLTSMLYGGSITYHGKVAGLSGGTGAAFALIPAQNATGNWIKITQRVPVRITLDPAELKEHPLRIGLSMEAEIDVSGD